ncbi:RNA polymerase sigma factor [Larkinella bovis]|uniref:RNA polymerase sigma factor n=1 Tax=Larkinella bovis TaxID=683041 RepID=A0ABW0I8D3_9BACT
MDCLDERILRKVIEGDQAAFAELYKYYRTPALKFCITLLKDEEEAENMIHEVFIKIWDRRSQINPSLNFTSYLFTCLRNLAFDHLKKMEKNNQLKQAYVERMAAARDEEVEDKEMKFQLLYSAVNLLSEKRKQILFLNIEQGKSYQEIAEMLMISKNTVKNQLVKAKQFLREKVDLATL